MQSGREIQDELRAPVRELRRTAPEAWAGWAALHEGAMGDGALDRKTKELIALAISVSKQCDGCIVSHAKGAARHGATPEEVADALGVAILMNGGPATVYGPRAFALYQEFAPPAEG